MGPENKYTMLSPAEQAAGEQAVAAALRDDNTLKPSDREALGMGAPAGAVQEQTPELQAAVAASGSSEIYAAGNGATLRQEAASGVQNPLPAELQRPNDPNVAVRVPGPGGPQ